MRDIFEVYAKVCDANGTWNTLSGYPKSFDSRNYGDDIDKTRNKARGEYYSTLGAMYPREDRQLQIVMLIDAYAGGIIAFEKIGEFAENIPQPEPEPEQAETVIETGE